MCAPGDERLPLGSAAERQKALVRELCVRNCNRSEELCQRRAGGNIGNPNAGAGGGAAGGADDRILFTRWVYNQGASRYAFVMDKFNRVVQIEAIGMSDSKVRTSRGIKFGSTFADVIKAYNAPDAYEITGDNIVVRYLVRDHVAFRLAKLKAKDVHRVTGIVVAAGKS